MGTDARHAEARDWSGADVSLRGIRIARTTVCALGGATQLVCSVIGS